MLWEPWGRDLAQPGAFVISNPALDVGALFLQPGNLECFSHPSFLLDTACNYIAFLFEKEFDVHKQITLNAEVPQLCPSGFILP